jgi:hypothetical protein
VFIIQSSSRHVNASSLNDLRARQVSATLRRCCTVADLQLMLCGCRDLDVADWRAHTAYVGGLRAEDDLVRWFWECVAEMSEAKKGRLLAFATGSPRVAAAGCANPRGPASGDSSVKAPANGHLKAPVISKGALRTLKGHVPRCKLL